MRSCNEGQHQEVSRVQGFGAFFYRMRLGHGSHCVPYGRKGAPLGSGLEVLALNSLAMVQATISLEMGLTELRVAITRSQGGWTTSSI